MGPTIKVITYIPIVTEFMYYKIVWVVVVPFSLYGQGCTVVITYLKVAPKQWVLTEGNPESHLSVLGGHRTRFKWCISFRLRQEICFFFSVSHPIVCRRCEQVKAVSVTTQLSMLDYLCNWATTWLFKSTRGL